MWWLRLRLHTTMYWVWLLRVHQLHLFVLALKLHKGNCKTIDYKIQSEFQIVFFKALNKYDQSFLLGADTDKAMKINYNIWTKMKWTMSNYIKIKRKYLSNIHHLYQPNSVSRCLIYLFYFMKEIINCRFFLLIILYQSAWNEL